MKLTATKQERKAPVTPAKAGAQSLGFEHERTAKLDSRLRGNDEVETEPCR